MGPNQPTCSRNLKSEAEGMIKNSRSDTVCHIAEFRFSDQSTATTPAAVLGVEVDYSSCVC
jgi:hypothetical protein